MVEANLPDFSTLNELGKVDKETGQIRKKDDDSSNCMPVSEFVAMLLGKYDQGQKDLD